MVPLRFTGKPFKIMQITDLHQGLAIDGDTLRLLNGALDYEKPDLVIFTGDQIKGYSPQFKGGEPQQKIQKAIDSFIKPITDRSIPFAVTFGNHDRQAGLSNQDQLDIYRKYPGYVSGAYSMGAGTQCILIYDQAKETPLFALYLIDSQGNAVHGGYEAVRPEQIEWYRQVRQKQAEAYGCPLPAMVFQHIPVQEYYDALTSSDKAGKQAIRGNRTFKSRFYTLTSNQEGEMFGEAPCVPDINMGEFDALTEQGEVVAVFCGHDHKNSFVRSYKGVDLGYTQSAGFNEYGPGLDRGVRLIELDPDQPRRYRTNTLTYRQLYGKKALHPVKLFLYSHMPGSREQALSMILKGLGMMAVVAAVVLTALWII